MELALLTTALFSRYDITLVDQKQVCLASRLISGSGTGSLDDKYAAQTCHCNCITSKTGSLEFVTLSYYYARLTL
jgi:hypothetical protein